MMIKKIKQEVGHWKRTSLPLLLGKSKFGSIVYYLIFSKAFRREQYSVLAGKARYLQRDAEGKGNYYMLVRNTHRLEKGLLMTPRRETFATGYIRVTTLAYLKISGRQLSDNRERQKWFTDVLTEYFAATVTSNNSEISESRVLFESYPRDINTSNMEGNNSPYLRGKSKEHGVSYEEFYMLSRKRRSIRWFEDRDVPRELIDKAITVALQAPSACNRQPFEYRIIDDKEMLAQVVNIPMGTTGYSHSIRVMIVCVGNLDAYFDERDRHLIYIDASLANMALMYALETLGLGSCPINWPDIEKKEIQMGRLLGLKNYQRPIMCIGLGYPDKGGLVAYSAKESLKNIRNYN
jgi:nitroreductase